MEWISVNDSLPEEGDQVIITDGSCTYYAVKRYVEGWDYQIAEDYPLDSLEFSLNAMMEKDITHWMSLPSPPSN